MVKVIGRVKNLDGRTYTKINENFRTEAEAKKFKRFLGRGSESEVVRLRKKPTQSSGQGQFAFGMKIKPFRF